MALAGTDKECISTYLSPFGDTLSLVVWSFSWEPPQHSFGLDGINGMGLNGPEEASVALQERQDCGDEMVSLLFMTGQHKNLQINQVCKMAMQWYETLLFPRQQFHP